MTWVIALVILLVIIIITFFIFRSKQSNDNYLENLEEEAHTLKKSSKKPKVQNSKKPLRPKPKVQNTKKPLSPEPKEEPKSEPVVEVVPKPEPKVEVIPEIELPKKEYQKYSNSRAMEQLGLSQEEADMFIGELIDQIDSEIPGLETAIQNKDLEKIESISHMIKGSATSLGSGGVADVLIDFNTYVKGGDDKQIIQAHFENLKYYLVELKSQFS